MRIIAIQKTLILPARADPPIIELWGWIHVISYFELVVVFAYDTNIAPADWAQKEWERVRIAAQDIECSPTFIDRILVLSRGLIIPEGTTCKVMATNQEIAFREWFLHLVNFLSRETPVGALWICKNTQAVAVVGGVSVK